MCLNVTKYARIATVKRERTVYKVAAYLNNRKPNDFFSPYHSRHKIILNSHEKLNSNLKITRDIYNHRRVSEGFHTFKTIKEARDFIYSERWYFNLMCSYDGMVIIECKIPVGAEIVKGNFDSAVSYVSNEINYGEVIEKKKY